MYFVEINVSNVEINVWMFHRQRLPGAPQAVPANSPGTAQSAGLFPAAAHRFSRVFVPGSAHLRSHPCHRCVRFILLSEKLSVAYIMAWQFKSVDDKKNIKKTLIAGVADAATATAVPPSPAVWGARVPQVHPPQRPVYRHVLLRGTVRRVDPPQLRSAVTHTQIYLMNPVNSNQIKSKFGLD